RRVAVDDTLEPFDEPPLDILERELDALKRFALLALERVAKLAFAHAQPFVQLVQRLAPFDRMSLELGARVLDRLLRRALDLVSELDERGALPFALRLQSFRVSREPFLGLLDQSSLAAGKRLK